MTLKIQRAAGERFVTFTLSGRIEVEQAAELQKCLEVEAGSLTTFLDLKEVQLVDQSTVKFLARCEVDGITLKNCPAYIRKWIDKEKEGK